MSTRAEEIAWAAGLFEGEGCVAESDGRLSLRLNNTGEGVVSRFAAVVDLGRMYGPYENSLKDEHVRKPFWVWMAHGLDAYDAMNLLAPWLSPRRLERAREITALSFPVETSI